ncbi:UNVERIFIED_CONTAM: hypothetical protein Slati_3895900 [Sesamum latifolium]|uniref:Uncharacterized protein n=1 Tax=Sesamum latifolium TaxID=2727402 RepID=A0AAW2TLG4_9LAMI
MLICQVCLPGSGLICEGCLPRSGLIREGCLPGSRAYFLRRRCFEEVLWRGGSVSGSAGLGGPRTTVPLAGTRDVTDTTCRA